MPQGKCIYCGADCSPTHDYRRVEGWERLRSQGGANQITLRGTKDEWACRWCVGKLQSGVGLEQGSLL